MKRGKPVPLNPNHTHFILVDDGRKNRSGEADLALRSQFEKAVLDGIDWFIVIAIVRQVEFLPKMFVPGSNYLLEYYLCVPLYLSLTVYLYNSSCHFQVRFSIH